MDVEEEKKGDDPMDKIIAELAVRENYNLGKRFFGLFPKRYQQAVHLYLIANWEMPKIMRKVREKQAIIEAEFEEVTRRPSFQYLNSPPCRTNKNDGYISAALAVPKSTFAKRPVYDDDDD